VNLSSYLELLGTWALANTLNILFSVVTMMIGYIGYTMVKRGIIRFQESENIEVHLAYTLAKLAKWIALIVVLSVILIQFGITLGLLSGLLTVLGGTVIGFAAINTIGNAIAGLIVMVSHPFRVGDRITFKGQHADILDIDLIYTKMQTVDNVIVSVPNQELMKSEIENFGTRRIVRIHATITADFVHDDTHIEECLLAAAAATSKVLRQPTSFVRITQFQNFAVQYTLYVFINQIRDMREIEGDLRKQVFRACKQYDLDISTPSLIRVVSQTN
jgi:small-conductance mechanosensitive channel